MSVVTKVAILYYSKSFQDVIIQKNFYGSLKTVNLVMGIFLVYSAIMILGIVDIGKE